METVFATHPHFNVIVSPFLFDGLDRTLGQSGLIVGHKRLHAQFSWLCSAHRRGAAEESAHCQLRGAGHPPPGASSSRSVRLSPSPQNSSGIGNSLPSSRLVSAPKDTKGVI